MTDLDALRRALNEPPAEQFAPLDINKIMTSGRQIRRRRRAVIGAGAVLATAAVLIGVTTVVRAPAPSPPADPPLPTVSDIQPPVPKAKALGDVVRTGIQQPKGELVFFFSEVNVPELPNVHFAVNSGWLSPPGDLIGGIQNSELRRAGDAPGFHPIMGGDSALGTFTPAFGYFVGPAARIEAKVLGRTVRAQVAVWSENPDVRAYWFPEDAVPDAELLGRPVAYDAEGKRLN